MPAVLENGPLQVSVSLDPFSLDVRRGGRRLIRGLGLWAAAGESHDQFIQLTEGVIPHEALERPRRLGEVRREADGMLSGELGSLRIELHPERLVLDFTAAAPYFRAGADWDSRPGERFTGLGARHHEELDQTGRRVRLGADRRYTGPDCPPDMLEVGGIPQGDYAPVPWLLASRGYAVWIETDGDGAELDLGHRLSVSTRTAAGPFRLHVVTDPTPAARLRRFLRLTESLPALLPGWAYGHWKSRDVYEHQRDVEDDFDGYRRHRLPLDAIVIDSPWETQYNTWEPNPHQFDDFEGMVRRFRGDGVRTVVWVTPWVNLESADGQRPPDAESERLHREPASNYADGAEGGHFVKTEDGEPFVARWWMGTGRRSTWPPHAPRPGGASRRSACCDSASRASRPTTARATTSRRRCGSATAAAAPRPPGPRGSTTGAPCSARWTRSTPAPASCSAAPAGPASRRSASPGAATRAPTSGRSERS